MNIKALMFYFFFLFFVFHSVVAVALGVKDRVSEDSQNDEDALVEPDSVDSILVQKGVDVKKGARTDSDDDTYEDEMEDAKEEYDHKQEVMDNMGIVDADIDAVNLSNDDDSSGDGLSSLPSIILHVNSMGAITEKVIPAVAEKYGLDEIKVSKTLLSWTIPGYAYSDTKKKHPYDCVEVTSKYSLTVKLPLDSDDITAAFKVDNGLKTKWNLDNDNSVKGSLTLTTKYGADSDNFYCWGADILGWLIGSHSLTIATNDFSGTVDVVLDQSESVVQVSSADLYDFDIGIDVTGAGTIGDIIEGLVDLSNGSLAIHHFFGLSSCDSISSCTGDLVVAVMKIDEIKDPILELLNYTIATSAKVDGDVPVSSSGLSLGYQVSLSELSTKKDKNRLISHWPTNVTLPSNAEDSCADELTGYTPNSADDVNVHEDVNTADYSAAIPLSVISRTLYHALKEGMVCDALRSVGSNRTMNFQMTPYDEVQLIVPDPEEGEDHAKGVIIVIPVKLNNFVMTYPNVSYGTGEVTAKLTMAARIGLSGDNLVLNMYAPAVKNFSGKVTFDNGVAVHGADLESAPPTVSTPNSIVLPALTQIPEIDNLCLEIERVFFTEHAAQLGLNIAYEHIYR